MAEQDPVIVTKLVKVETTVVVKIVMDVVGGDGVPDSNGEAVLTIIDGVSLLPEI